MIFTETDIQGVWVIDPQRHEDDRGWFMRAWCAKEFADHGLDFTPLQANMGSSIHAGTVRGMHYQDETAPEAKLVRCTRGSLYDVAIDLRADSPTYGRWHAVELSAENGRMLYVPPLCAHGCQTLEKKVEIYYLASAFYVPSASHGVRFDDPAFGIHWPLAVTAVSAQDRSWPLMDSNRR